jgi:hypothetical protein
MESFGAEWLAIREPADQRSRAHALAADIGRRLDGRSPVVRAVDLGAGTGANVRYLLPRLPQIGHWTLVDHDAALLDLARQSLDEPARARGVTIEFVQADVRAIDELPIKGTALVTASALIDLVSADWMAALAMRCRQVGCAALFALTYDGRIDSDPPEACDAEVRVLVNRHQRTDKGFGPALGPDAVAAAEREFAGGRVVSANSDWVLDARDAELQRRLVDGWARAATEMAPDQAAEIASWRMLRLDHIARGRSLMRVGHQDLAIW